MSKSGAIVISLLRRRSLGWSIGARIAFIAVEIGVDGP